jgi:hypothetical protein
LLAEIDILMSSINPVSQLISNCAKSLVIALMAANAIGIQSYLRLASGGWRIPEEHGEIPISGEPFVWAFALPVLGVFVFVDAVWGVMLLRHKEWNGRIWLALIAIAWLAALVVDFSHH